VSGTGRSFETAPLRKHKRYAQCRADSDGEINRRTMGLMIHNLELLSDKATRDYFVYILDYGWDEPLSNVIRRNFDKLSNQASNSDSAIIIGVGEIGHFDNQVLSWHSINGEQADDILPAILITRTNPHTFRQYSDNQKQRIDEQFKYILIPLRKTCKSETDVVNLIHELFNDIKNKKNLDDFKVQKELKRGMGRAFVDSLILEPNLGGMGFSFNKFIDYLKRKE
jgi:uncharacterized FAD-dependent dehydrogenase